MPKKGGEWPTVDDMIQKNQRLVFFTSKSAEEASEEIAYEWRYVIENQYGDGGMIAGSCPNSAESPAMNTTSRSLVLVNYFPDRPDPNMTFGAYDEPEAEVASVPGAADSSFAYWMRDQFAYGGCLGQFWWYFPYH
ncbi:hypothetical protein GH714_034237 [Hevea brasiliensis]|uniref:Uncharacterized protein n=1 Tax=Hevea brasiliensis TaxID=3981 RepID=A0A6A6N978_HEVBR|nr:hypothetical protein GH714_034237 [Hevea brasiliensis]